MQRKQDSIFQIILNFIHTRKRKRPMHVALSEATLDTFKRLIQIMNHLVLCFSYDEGERIDTALVQHKISMADSHRVQVPLSIVPCRYVHGAMDNYDHKENTISGIEGSQDTILMLLQNI